MTNILNTAPETLGVGAVVKFNSSCPVIATLIKDAARLSMGSVSGKATFTVVTPGDYEFKATCDCGGSYTVMYAGAGEAECCVNPLTNPAGEMVGIEIAGEEFFSPAVSDPVSYTWVETNANDGDGVIEWTGTPSDGSAPQVITFAEPTIDTDTLLTGSTLDPVTGIVTQTFADADGNVLPNQLLDLSALIASEHPNLASGNGVHVAFDATANEWVISNTAPDTDTFSTLSGGTLTLADGQTYDLTHAAAVDNGDGTGSITNSDGTVVTFTTTPDSPCAEPIATPVQLQSATDVYLQVCVDGTPMLAGLLDLLQIDTDGDTLTDITEIVTHDSDPNNPDTDGGGVDDGAEVAAGTDPLDAADDVCQLMKNSANLVLIGASAGNDGPLYYAWSVPEGIATDPLNASAGNTDQVLYGIPVASAGCATTDPDFESVNSSAGNTSPTHYLLKA